MRKPINFLINRAKWLTTRKRFIIVQKINFFFFPFFYFLMFVFILIESYMYPGFLRSHILIGLRAILIVFVFSGISAKLSLFGKTAPRQIVSHYQLISTLNKLFLPALVFVIFLLLSIENAHHPGYVYTRVLHVEPKILFFSFLVAIFILILDFDDSLAILMGGVKSVKWGLLKRPERPDYLHLLLLTLISWIFFGNILKSVPSVYARLQFILKNPGLTYEEKMRSGWGVFYDYMMFINENTPPDATIMHPPFDPPWERVGNGGLVRYFIYPRDEVYSFKGISDKGSKPTHMMIAYGWPDFQVKAKKLIYMPKTATESAEIVYGDYDPDEPRNKDKNILGLIELEE